MRLLNSVSTSMIIETITNINNNIRIKYEKLQKKQFKRNENGVNTFKDLLYIFKLIWNKREVKISELIRNEKTPNCTINCANLNDKCFIFENFYTPSTSCSESKAEFLIKDTIQRCKESSERKTRIFFYNWARES